MWQLKYDNATPPLPSPIPLHSKRASNGSIVKKLLPEGCWYLWLAPTLEDDLTLEADWLVYYRGTLRIEHDSDGTTASGDLYLRRQVWYESDQREQPPDPANPHRIPILPRADYRYYLRLIDLQVVKKTLTARFATYRFDQEQSVWTEAGELTARLKTPKTKSQEWPDGYLTGKVVNDRGTTVGRIQLGRVASYFREATVEIDKVKGVFLPVNEKLGLTLDSHFKKVKWKVTVPAEHDVVPSPGGEVFKDSALHETMLEWRDRADLDDEWRYHILVVERFRENPELRFGMMYDDDNLDSNLIPREGAVIAARARFPDEPKYGTARGKFLEEVPVAFFRATVHELCHCMGLMHTYTSNGFQQATVFVADDLHLKFPEEIPLKFDPDDAHRLKHLPDPWVRPGGPPAGFRFTRLPIPDDDVMFDEFNSFQLKTEPVQVILPLGAPLRLKVALKNVSNETRPAPPSLDFESGSVSGCVRGPAGENFFATAKHLFGPFSEELDAGGMVETSMTLMRGAGGPLFPCPGFYTVVIEVVWRGPGGMARVRNEISVLVTEPSWPSGAVALSALASRELSIPLIFRTRAENLAGSSRASVEEGLAVLQLAVRDPVLGPHFQAIEAIRLAEQGGDGVKLGFALLGPGVVVSAWEIERLLVLLGEECERSPRLPRDSSVGVGLDRLLQAAEKLADQELRTNSLTDKMSELLGDGGRLAAFKPGEPRRNKRRPGRVKGRSRSRA